MTVSRAARKMPSTGRPSQAKAPTTRITSCTMAPTEATANVQRNRTAR